MNKRLQVMIDETELKELLEITERQHVSLAEWVRIALRAARDSQPRSNLQGKMDAVRNALQYSYPVSDIDDMLGEIKAGYGPGTEIGSDKNDIHRFEYSDVSNR